MAGSPRGHRYTPDPVKATVEPLEGNRVKLSVEVEEKELDPVVDSVLRQFSREARIPGFRPGKVPRKVLEAHLGPNVVRGEALREAIPDHYEAAVRQHELEPIAPPDIDITGGEDGGPVQFHAVVEVRPEVEISGYDSLSITIPSVTPSEADVDEQIERLRQNHGELSGVERPATDGDRVTINVEGSRDGEALESASAEDYVYEVGSGVIVDELDQELRGAKPGDVLSFTAEDPAVHGHDPETLDEHDHRPIEFKVLVKEVRELLLPDLDDEFANDASEFDTLAELREDLADRMARVRKAQAGSEVRQRTAEAVAGLVDVEPPEALVSQEMQQRLQDLLLRLQAQGIELDVYLQATGGSQQQLLDDLKQAAQEAVRLDLALRALAEAEGIEVDDDDLDQELAELAERVQQTPAEVREQLERAEQVPAVRSDLRRRKALDWVMERIEVLDEDGNAVDVASLEEPDEADEEIEIDEIVAAGEEVEDTDEPAPEADGKEEDEA
jgi:trigger factor